MDVRISNLADLTVVVQSMEDGGTLGAVSDILRVDPRIDWDAIRKEAKAGNIAPLASLDKNFYKTVVKHVCSPDAWKRGGDHHSTAYRRRGRTEGDRPLPGEGERRRRH